MLKRVDIVEGIRRFGTRKSIIDLYNYVREIKKRRIEMFVKDLKDPIKEEGFKLPDGFRIEILSKDRKEHLERYCAFTHIKSNSLTQELLENGICFLGFVGEELIAFFWIVTNRIPYLTIFDIHIENPPRHLYEFYIFVKEQFRRKGISSYLKKIAIEEFKSNYTHIWSLVESDNLANMEANKRNGFIHYGYGMRWEWFLFKGHYFKKTSDIPGFDLRIKSFGKKEITI